MGALDIGWSSPQDRMHSTRFLTALALSQGTSFDLNAQFGADPPCIYASHSQIGTSKFTNAPSWVLFTWMNREGGY